MNKAKNMSNMSIVQWCLWLVFSSMLAIFSQAALSQQIASQKASLNQEVVASVSPDVMLKSASDEMIKKIEQARSMPADKKHAFFYGFDWDKLS